MLSVWQFGILVAEWTKRLQRAKVSVILTKPENRCYGNTDFYLILIEKMKETGIQVIMVDEDTECFAIIDQELVWHGGMNLLGKVDAWDNLIRIKSESIVQELMGMILKEFCDNDVTSSPLTLWQLYNVLYTEICGFKPFLWQKSRIFFVAMTWHPRGHCVSGIVCRGEESRYIRLCVRKIWFA